MMLRKLKPNNMFRSIIEINPLWLNRHNIKGVIIDLDNTSIPWGEWRFNEELLQWVRQLKQSGIRLCILSNGSPWRIRKLAAQLRIPAVTGVVKPHKKAFRLALEVLRTESERTAVIGDQLFTDILGGNRLGMHTILVVPLSSQEFIGTKFLRCLEKLVIRRMRKKLDPQVIR